MKYGQFCPIARASEVFADRWTPLILRELLAGPSGFNELQRGLPGISRSLLLQRLRNLERAAIVERIPGPGGRAKGYLLTEAGLDLKRVLDELGDWGARWRLTEPDPEELDPYLVVLFMSRHLNPDRLPAQRVVLRFDFPGRRTRRFWLVLDPGNPSVCLKDPGFDTDLVVTAETSSLYQIYFGRLEISDAKLSGSLKVEGAPALTNAFPAWFRGSDFAATARLSAGAR